MIVSRDSILRILDEDGTVVIEGEVDDVLADGNGEIYEISIAAQMRLAWFRKLLGPSIRVKIINAIFS